MDGQSFTRYTGVDEDGNKVVQDALNMVDLRPMPKTRRELEQLIDARIQKALDTLLPDAKTDPPK